MEKLERFNGSRSSGFADQVNDCIAVSTSDGCEYCIYSHTAAIRKKEMTDEMFGELMAVMRMANEPNRLVHGYQVHMDPQFHKENYDQLFHSKSKKDVEI